jgi:hypothetical protein
MHTDDLVAIRDALTAIIAFPPPVRDVVASLIASRATPNGEDPRLPAFPAVRTPPRSSRRKLIGEWKRPTPEEVRASESRLLDALRAAPDAGVAELARRVSTVSMRLGRLAERGEVERIGGKMAGRRGKPSEACAGDGAGLSDDEPLKTAAPSTSSGPRVSAWSAMLDVRRYSRRMTHSCESVRFG